MSAEGRLIYGAGLTITLIIATIISTIGIIKGKDKSIRRIYGAVWVVCILQIIFNLNNL